MQEREQEESEVNYRGVCICKIDASSTVLPPRQQQPSSAAPNLGPFLRYGLVAPQAAAGDGEAPRRRLPEITSIAMNSSMSVAPPFMDDTVATVGGEAAIRPYPLSAAHNKNTVARTQSLPCNLSIRRVLCFVVQGRSACGAIWVAAASCAA